jgi:hypothetical protein
VKIDDSSLSPLMELKTKFIVPGSESERDYLLLLSELGFPNSKSLKRSFQSIAKVSKTGLVLKKIE